MRDAARARRTQAGVLLGLCTGVLGCVLTWTSSVAAERLLDWEAPLEPPLLAGLAGLVAMLAGARWGQR